MNKLFKQRAFALDAFRGYAILTMVLSGTIANTLPRWMYHAQTPPPDHVFTPTVYGITWVDLVFPFFLFAMGAALPFSISRRLEQGESRWRLLLDIVSRGTQLVFFAIFLQHIYPWVQAEHPAYREWFITLFGFVLMFPMFMRLPGEMPSWWRNAIKLLAFGIASAMMLLNTYANGKTFSLSDSNIIILVLANMAIFGAAVYVFTLHNRIARLSVLPFLMAILLCMSDDFLGSWQKSLFDFSPFPWFYKFYYLKYLFIVIPGTIAGEYLMEWMCASQSDSLDNVREKRILPPVMLALVVTLIAWNLYGLLTRQLVLNLLVTQALLVFGWLAIRKHDSFHGRFWKKLFCAGAYLLMLGLFFEAFEGGIRKDVSTFSYYFVTSGLAFMGLLAFSVMCDYFGWYKATAFLSMSGQNPMIAYVGSSLVLGPLLNVTGIMKYVDLLNYNAWTGLLRGVGITLLVTLVTMFFTKIKWFWRT